jgi:hypothetical protein
MTTNTEILGFEDAQTVSIRSGNGIYEFHLNATAMTVLRQAAEGQILALRVTSFGSEFQCFLAFDDLPMMGRVRLVAGLVNAIDALLDLPEGRLTGPQREAFGKAAQVMTGMLAAAGLHKD